MTKSPIQHNSVINPHTLGVATASACILLGLNYLSFHSADIPAGLYWPYIWSEVAAVSLLSAIPFAVSLGMLITGRTSVRVGGLLSLLVLIAACWWMADAETRSRLANTQLGTISGTIVRAAIATGLAFAVVLFVKALHILFGGIPMKTDRRSVAIASTFGLIVVLLVPAAYIDYRGRQVASRASEMIGQFRLGEALILTRELEALSPTIQVNDRPVSYVVRKLESQVAEIRAALPSLAQANQQLKHAQQFAVVGEVKSAIAILQPLTKTDPQAASLLGTLYENAEEWQNSLSAYRQSEELWIARTESPQRSAGLYAAVRGIAYAQRKMGNLKAADVAYRRLLHLSPTAETHYLLAQFYEDTQQAAESYRHIRLAMKLAPLRYKETGRELITRLESSQFGCFSVFRQESNQRR